MVSVAPDLGWVGKRVSRQILQNFTLKCSEIILLHVSCPYPKGPNVLLGMGKAPMPVLSVSS